MEQKVCRGKCGSTRDEIVMQDSEEKQICNYLN